MDNSGKVVLITGGTSGFGRAIAEKMAQQGAQVIITGRSEARVQETAAQLGVKGVAADVSRPEDWVRVRDLLEREYGRLDVLVNNAGTGVVIKDLCDQTLEEIRLCVDINLMGPIYGIHYLAPLMKRQHSGTIINLSSVCAGHAWPGYSVYAAAKAGVRNLSKSAYVELQEHGIRSVCVIPGAGQTNFQVNAQDAPLPENADNLKPEDMAQVVCDICALPEHVVVEETTVWGRAQVVRPL